MSEPARRRMRFTRDAAIIAFALAAGGYEIAIGGGRPSVLTFLSALVLSPLVLRADEVRRGGDR